MVRSELPDWLSDLADLPLGFSFTFSGLLFFLQQQTQQTQRPIQATRRARGMIQRKGAPRVSHTSLTPGNWLISQKLAPSTVADMFGLVVDKALKSWIQGLVVVAVAPVFVVVVVGSLPCSVVVSMAGLLL